MKVRLIFIFFIALGSSFEASACCPQGTNLATQSVRYWHEQDAVFIRAEGQLGECCGLVQRLILDSRGNTVFNLKIAGDADYIESVGEATVNLQHAPKLEKALKKIIDPIISLKEAPAYNQQDNSRRKSWETEFISAVKTYDREVEKLSKPASKLAKCPITVERSKNKVTYKHNDPATKNSLPVFSGFEGCVPTEDEFTPESCTKWNSGYEGIIPISNVPQKCFTLKSGDIILIATRSVTGPCQTDSFDFSVRVNNATLRYLIANIEGFRLYKQKDYTGARKKFEESLKEKPDYHHANFNMACTLALSGAPLAEGKLYLERLFQDTASRDLYVMKIQSDPDLDSWRRQELSEWLKTHLKELKKGDEEGLPPARQMNNLGLKAYLKKDYAGAVNLFNKAIETNPNYVVAMTNLASVFVLQGRLDEAIKMLTRAHKMNKTLTQRKMSTDKDFGLIRDNPKFKELLRK